MLQRITAALLLLSYATTLALGGSRAWVLCTESSGESHVELRIGTCCDDEAEAPAHEHRHEHDQTGACDECVDTPITVGGDHVSSTGAKVAHELLPVHAVLAVWSTLWPETLAAPVPQHPPLSPPRNYSSEALSTVVIRC